MNHRFVLLSSLAMLLLSVSCTRSEYDPSNRINKEMTLFGEEIYVPVGQVGPVTVKSLLSSSKTIGDLVNTLLKEEYDGTFYVESDDAIYAYNAYRQALEIPDSSQPYHWDIGSQSGSVASMASLLRMVNMGFVNQHLTLYVLNPITASLNLNTDIWVRCTNSAYVETYSKEFKMEDYNLKSSYSKIPIVKLDLPADLTDMVSRVEFNDLTLDLPANVGDKIRTSDDAKYSFGAQYKANPAPTENFSFAQAFPLSNLNVPLGKFKLHKCVLSFDLENTLPFDVTVRSIKLMNKKGDYITDVVFSSDIKIMGGKPGAPAVTPVELQVEALEGTIPDIEGVAVDVKIAYSPSVGAVPLSSAMGLSLKSASVKLHGGITLFGK